MSTHTKIIDLGQLAPQFKCGELQFYTRHLHQTATTTPLPFLVIPGASATYHCKDGAVSVPTYLIENNEAYREWHKQALQEMNSHLRYDPKLPATLDAYSSITREQLLIIAAQATHKQHRTPRSATDTPGRKKNATVRKTGESSGKPSPEQQQSNEVAREQNQQGHPGESNST